MRIILVSLIIYVIVVQQISEQHEFHHEHHHFPGHAEFDIELQNTLDRYKAELHWRFLSLQSRIQGAVGNNYNQMVEKSLRTSSECTDLLTNSTLNSKTLETSLQAKVDQLEKKLQDTEDQLLHINKTCNCRIATMKNFQKIGNRFYRFENKLKLNWFAANKRCQKLGGHLSSLQDEDELEMVQGHLTESDYWLGINDLDIPDEYRVSLTGQKATVLNWAAGEPQIYDGNSHCVHLERDVFDYSIRLQRCSLQYNFICEKVLYEHN